MITTCVLLAALGAVNGCGREDRNRAGFGLLPPTISGGGGVQDTVLAGAAQETTYQFRETEGTAGGGTRLIAAALPFVASRILVHVPTPPVDSVIFRHAWLDLGIAADSTLAAIPALELYEVVQPWSEALRGDRTFPAFLGTPVATGVFTPADSDTVARVRFEGAGLDSVVARWVATGSRQHLNAGLMIAIADGDSGRVEFYSRENSAGSVERRPRFSVKYLADAAVADSIDTTGVLVDRDVYVADRAGTGSVADLPGRLTIASGVPARTLLRFDLSAFATRAIHRALLKLSVDSSASSDESLAVRVNAVSDSAWSGEDTEASTSGTVSGTIAIENGVPTWTFEITTMARSWALRESDNAGAMVHASDEVNTIEWVRFFDSTAADSLRPRLYITSSPLAEETP